MPPSHMQGTIQKEKKMDNILNNLKFLTLVNFRKTKAVANGNSEAGPVSLTCNNLPILPELAAVKICFGKSPFF